MGRTFHGPAPSWKRLKERGWKKEIKTPKTHLLGHEWIFKAGRHARCNSFFCAACITPPPGRKDIHTAIMSMHLCSLALLTVLCKSRRHNLLYFEEYMYQLPSCRPPWMAAWVTCESWAIDCPPRSAWAACEEWEKKFGRVPARKEHRQKQREGAEGGERNR